jgi:peptidoglycan hydrolase-like protein with peptidoglycan-binding domain
MRRLALATVALAIVPGVLLAQADSSRMRGRDSTHRRTEQSSTGSIGRRSYGLNRDQIMQLQTALQTANCNPGAIDGVLGPRTRSAMACARRQNNITGNNPNDLFRSLNLGFTTPDSTGMGGVMRSGRRGARGAAADTSMGNMNMANDSSRTHARRRGTRRTGRDSTMNGSTRPDSAGRAGMPSRPGSTRRRPGTTTRPDTTRRP